MSAFERPNNQGVTQNPSEVSDILNRFFSSVGRKLADNVPSSSRHFSDYFADQVYPNSFFFYPVTPSEVESEILSTPPNKATETLLLINVLAFLTISRIKFSRNYLVS